MRIIWFLQFNWRIKLEGRLKSGETWVFCFSYSRRVSLVFFFCWHSADRADGGRNSCLESSVRPKLRVSAGCFWLCAIERVHSIAWMETNVIVWLLVIIIISVSVAILIAHAIDAIRSWGKRRGSGTCHPTGGADSRECGCGRRSALDIVVDCALQFLDVFRRGRAAWRSRNGAVGRTQGGERPMSAAAQDEHRCVWERCSVPQADNKTGWTKVAEWVPPGAEARAVAFRNPITFCPCDREKSSVRMTTPAWIGA